MKTNVMTCMMIAAGCVLAPLSAALAQKADASTKEQASLEKADLRTKYRTGQEFTLTQHVVYTDGKSMVMKEGDAPMAFESVADQTVEYKVKVDGASESGTSLSIELTSLKVKAKVPQGDYSWDSASPPDDKDEQNPVVVTYKPIVGLVTQVMLGADGAITDVKPDARSRPPANTVLQSAVAYLMGTEQAKARWAPILCIKPGSEPAAVGSSWSRSDVTNAAPINASFAFEMTSTLKSVSGADADIAMTGDIKVTSLEKERQADGKIKKVFRLGKAVWDTKAGLIKSCATETSYTMDISKMGSSVTRKLKIASETKRKE